MQKYCKTILRTVDLIVGLQDWLHKRNRYKKVADEAAPPSTMLQANRFSNTRHSTVPLSSTGGYF